MQEEKNKITERLANAYEAVAFLINNTPPNTPELEKTREELRASLEYIADEEIIDNVFLQTAKTDIQKADALVQKHFPSTVSRKNAEPSNLETDLWIIPKWEQSKTVPTLNSEAFGFKKEQPQRRYPLGDGGKITIYLGADPI